MNRNHPQKSKPLSKFLSVVFFLALILGPGPGAMLIDGTQTNPHFVAGIPALYLWLVFWFAVMAGCVIVASCFIWKDQD